MPATDFLNESLRRIAYLLSSRRRSRELADEMSFHREMHQRTAGQSTDASSIASATRRHFGNDLRLREQAREAWGWTWIDRLLQDLRYATRMLIRASGFTITAILILAIGIGVNVSAFSIFDLAALKPLPLRDPDSLISLEPRSPTNINPVLPYPTALFFRQHTRTLSAVIAEAGARMQLEKEAQAGRVNFVSANYFKELGETASSGRLFDAAIDEAPGAAPVAVLGYDYWQNHLNADPAVVGKTIHVNQKVFTR